MLSKILSWRVPNDGTGTAVWEHRHGSEQSAGTDESTVEGNLSKLSQVAGAFAHLPHRFGEEFQHSPAHGTTQAI